MATATPKHGIVNGNHGNCVFWLYIVGEAFMHRRAKPTVNANIKGQKLVTSLATWSEIPTRDGLTGCSLCMNDCGDRGVGSSASAQHFGQETTGVLQRYKPVSNIQRDEQRLLTSTKW